MRGHVHRKPTHRYVDPLDAVWLVAARRMGLTVERSAEVYAATDGRGRLLVGAPETLDPDDCMAQIVFHEICHWLVMGRAAAGVADWGLDNLSDRHRVHERACLRVQASLAQQHGLRAVLAPTTDHRPFYDGLPANPLAGDDESVALAREALTRAEGPPWAPHLGTALRATAAIARAAEAAGAGSLQGSQPSLWELVRGSDAEMP